MPIHLRDLRLALTPSPAHSSSRSSLRGLDRREVPRRTRAGRIPPSPSGSATKTTTLASRVVAHGELGEFAPSFPSAPPSPNDKALVEGKNAHVVRRHLGHEHIPVRFAGDVDRFCREDLSPLLNFHRPACSPPSAPTPRARRGEPTAEDVKTPLAKVKSLPDAASFLKDGATFDALDRAAASRTGLQAAEALDRARGELFRKVHGAPAAA